MPHARPRHLESRIRQALAWSPSVSLVGMRQSGKTTLVKRICPGYLSFDDDALVGATEAGQWGRLLAQPRPLALDEVQKAPRVFSRLKLWIDERRRPGQFVLTGSVRFLSRRARGRKSGVGFRVRLQESTRVCSRPCRPMAWWRRCRC